MTTIANAHVLDHSNDANFRAWVADFIADLAAVGLVQTADTGQFTNTSETRPASNTVTPYAVFGFNDSLQGTSPIYIKFLFGTSTAATRVRIDIIVGTGTDGAGTITGTALSGQLRTDSAGGGFSTGTSYTTWMAAGEGYFWFAHAINSVNTTNCANGAVIARSADSAGDPDGVGGHIFTFGNGATIIKNLRFASTAAAYTSQGSTFNATAYLCHIIYPEASTLVGGVPQVVPGFGFHPDGYPLFHLGAVKLGEIADATTFTWTPFGATSHTYLCVNNQMGRPFTINGGVTLANYGLALIWE